jgi:hypothetical protein
VAGAEAAAAQREIETTLRRHPGPGRACRAPTHR